MKEKFREIRLSPKNKQKLEVINDIINEYAADGYVMTLRQLYYQLVSRDIIPNKDSEYKKIGNLLVEGRMAGIVDWDAIEDRLRVPYLPYYCDDPADAMYDIIRQYKLDRQKGQKKYIEVWVEKDALSGVLKRITSTYHVRLLVNRGYASATAIHDAYERFSKQIGLGKECKILYLGDHDPSGIDMIRDINKRIREMLFAYADHYFSIEPIALTMDQINKYNPPKNPAKITDPRAKWYINKYGPSSWEVDALDPKTLNKLLSSHIETNIDMSLYYSIIDKEAIDGEKLQKIADEL